MKKFIGNLLFVTVLIALTFFFLLRKQDWSYTLVLLSKLNLKYIILGILLMFIYSILEVTIVNMFLKVFGYKKSLFSMIKYAFIGFFYSGITPSSTGGQPMIIYHMNKEGIKISHSTIALILQLASYHIMTLIFMIIGVICNYKYLIHTTSYFGILIILGILIKIVVLTVLLSLILFPSMVNKAKKLIYFFIRVFRLKNQEELKEKWNKELDQFKDSSKYLKNNKNVFYTAIYISFFQILAFYSTTYMAVKAFNISNVSYLNILSLQAVLFSGVSSIPLPGTIGVNELGFTILFAPVVGELLVNNLAIVSRFINFYFFVLLGGIVSVIVYLKQKNVKHYQKKSI